MMFLENIELIGLLFVIYLSSFIADMISGLELNVLILKNKFCYKKLFKSFLKAISIAIILFLLTFIISFLPDILENANIDIMDGAADTVSLLSIVTLIVSATIKYFIDSMKKLSKILNLEDEDIIKLSQETKKEETELDNTEKNIPIRIERSDL